MFEEVKAVLVERLMINPDIITMDSDFVSDLGVSSIDVMDFACVCQEKFDIEIPDEEIFGFTTVGDVVRFLEENKK